MPTAPKGLSDEEEPFRRRGEADAWSAFSYVLSGMLLWGAVGWGVSRWLGSPAWIGLGLMVGTTAGVALVWLRYGRSP